MNNIISIFTLFSLLVGIMLFVLWSNIHVYAQQPSSVTSAGVSTSISEELKAKMCDPSNPDLKVVNTTEARICGIAKTEKPGLASAVSTSQSTSAESSSSPTQQTVTTKPTTATTAPPKQQQIANTNNIPRSSGSGTPIAPLSHSTSASPSGIAPQVEVVKQQQRPPITLINNTTGMNNTAGQNYTFAAISPAATSGQVLYLGYHGVVTNPTQGNSGSKHDDNHDSTKRVSDSSSKHDDGTSSANKKTSNTKSDRIDSANAESSSKDKKTHNGDSSSDSRSSSKKWTKSDDVSSKQDDDSSSATSSTHSENSFSSVIVKSFNPKHSDSSESSSIDDHIPSVIVRSFNFN
jgi:hypothetical protein